MFINRKEKFSIRKFKDGRSDSVKIGTVALLVGAALAMSGQSQTAAAEVKDNGDNTTTISNDKGSITVDTANITNEVEGTTASTDPTENGTNTITKTGKVDYKYVTAEGNTVLEENKNQDSGADKTIETPYDVYGKSGEVFKGTTGGDAEASDLDNAKETGKKETIEKDGKTYHLIGEPKVETTGDGGGVYSDTTLGDVTAKLTPEGLSNAEGKITYDTVKPGGKAWIVEQTGKGTYGKYVQANSGDITSDDKMRDAFKSGEAAAKNFTSANVTADGGIKEGDYVFVLEKNTYVTVSDQSPEITGVVPLSPKDNVADDEEGSGASIDRTYAMVQKFKAAPDTATGEANRTFVKNYLAYLQEKGLEDNTLNFKRYISVGIAAKGGEKNAIKADTGDQVDDKGRPTTDVTANFNDVYENSTSKFGDDINLNLGTFTPEIEEYSYRDEITPLRAYRLASGTTTITYTYAEEKTREIEKKGSVVVNYQTEDGTELKAPYTDTPETVAEVVTEKYYVDANGQDVVVSSTKASKNVAYNTKKSADEKPEKLTDAQGNVYYLKADATKTAVNDVEKDAPAEEGTVVEGVTNVTYIYEKAGSVIVNYKTVDGTPLTGTVVDEDGAGKTVESGAKDIDNGKPGTAYNTADNGMKPTRIKTAEGKVYELVPESTEGEEKGEVVAGETKVVTYVYKEVKGNVVVKYEDTEGNSLAADEQDETDASLNVKYDTADHKKESITKDGVKYYLTAKELKDDSKPATGDVVEGTTTVTYVYEKAGQVVVNYQTEDGTPLEGTADGANVASGAKDTTDAKAGTDYNTADNGMKPNRITTAEGKVYELVPTATKGEETGKVVAGETKEVTYVYKEVKGNVVVKYEDTEGNVIAEDEKDETDASLNVKYDTADHKKDEITKDGVKYYLTAKALKDGSKETGDVVEGTTTVTYVYEKAGQVVVNYQTEDGTPIVGVDAAGANVASGAKDTVDGRPGSAYDTSDNGMKPNRITTPEGKVYELVPTATKGDETGTVVAGETKEVTYVYKEVTGDVVVHYVDTEGNTIAADKDDLKGASLSEKYDTAVDNKPEKITAEDGTVYYITKAGLKDDSKPETGNVVEGKTDVTYVYEKAGSVIVNYQTEDGTPLVGTADGKDIASGAKDTDNGKPGSEYNTADNGMKPTRITTAEGKVYELVPTATKGDETGKVVAGETKEVTYVYKEVTGDVVVHYVDTEGNVIAEDKEDTKGASLNAKYDTTDNKPEKIEKDGTVYYLTEKALKDDSKPENGDVVEGKTEVTYVYEKAGQVVVHYTDEKGNTIQVDAVDTKDGKPNSGYNTADNGMKPNRITTPEGKVYELIPQSTKGDETGKVKAGETTEVTYVYKEITGNVVVHYVDTEGNTLAEDTKDVENGSLSDKYDTTDNKPAKLEKDGVVYYLTAKELKEDSKPENGAVVEGTTEITYVYEKAGNVLVHYVDEAGNTLQADAVDTKDGQPGAKYDTSDNDMKPTRITTPEGKVFELVPASTKGNETGDVEAGKTTEVTYVYKEVKGNVVVHYTDEAGNTIAEDVKDTTDGSVSSAYDTTDNKPATITTKDGKLYVLVPTSTKGEESGKVTEGTTEVTYVYKDIKEEASKEIDKALSEKESKIKENPELTNEEKEKAIEEAKKSAEQAKKALEEAKTPEDVEKSTTKGKEDVEKTPVTPEDKPKAKEAIDKALENKVKKIDEDPSLTPEQKEKAKEEAKKDAEEAKKTIDKAPSKEEVEKAKENGKKEVEKDTPTPDQPSTPSNPSEGDKDKPSTPSEGDKDKPYTPSPEDKAKAKETVDKQLEEKIKNIDKDPSLTPEQKEKAKEEAKKEAEKVKKSIDEGKTTEWVDEKGNPIKPVTPGTYPAGSTPNYELVGTVTNPETGKVTHIFKPVTKEEKTTVWVDVNGKPLKPAKPGTEEAGKVPNYKLVGTTVDPTTGNVIHVFTPTPVVNKVTEWVDTEGKVIRPQEDGSKDPGKVPNYELVGTVTNPETGKVTHIFKPTISDKPSTVWVDVNGKPLKPTAPGKEEAGSVPKYKLVETKINPETGDVIHVFTPTPVVNKVTEWIDTEGNVIRPQEDGSKDPGKVPNYELVGTVKDPETGKVTHIFKPVTKKQVTVWVDVNGKPLKPLAEGSNPAGEVPGYELVGTKVDPETGNLLHVYKPKGSVTPGTNPGTPGENPGMPGQNPGTPGTPANPEKPMDPNAPANPTTPANPATPTMPSAPVNGEAPQAPAATSEAKGQAELPNTGTADNASLAALGLLGVLSGFGLVARKKKED
ncbi:MucBP domain-containing protein [Streptococcus vestibularis]|uniref:MucBP domain-containing protein n=1 Tax=Streptococcus vestibularis TaxID=1343 RepID=UPI0026719F40|nr:MucBP domain-containing protein [Streptococcus vestibularis]